MSFYTLKLSYIKLSLTTDLTFKCCICFTLIHPGATKIISLDTWTQLNATTDVWHILSVDIKALTLCKFISVPHKSHDLALVQSCAWIKIKISDKLFFLTHYSRWTSSSSRKSLEITSNSYRENEDPYSTNLPNVPCP